MPLVTIFPFNKTLEVDSGTTIANVIRRAGFTLRASCGDMGTCGDCLVKVLSGKFDTKPSAGLCGELLKEGYTLACSSMVIEDITIEVPYYGDHSLKAVFTSDYFEKHKDRISGKYDHKPFIKVYEFSIPEPTIEDNYSDLRRVVREIEKSISGKIDFEFAALKKLAVELRKEDHKLYVVMFHNDCYNVVLDLSSKPIKPYGLSIDVGTTTVAVQLVDLSTGEIVDTGAAFNKQISCGSDVISRINYSQKEAKLNELHRLVTSSINEIVADLCHENKIYIDNIYYSVISGNTTMIHLFLELEPRFIREEPYVPTVNDVPFFKASEVGLKMNPSGITHFNPCIGSYVGGDITSGLLCTPILKETDKNYLFIDVGTNGELVLGNKDWLITCACSAGPAFEGSGTSCGMPAMSGALEKIEIKSGKISYHVIGEDKPRGICGSGMIDLLAELLLGGYIDKFGKFHDDICGDRLITYSGNKAFVIVNSSNSETGEPVYITENDIANLIRTKGAIFSAISLLLKSVGITFEDIDSFFIAGGFGKHLNIENSIRIGLFPDIDRSKFNYIGNSSLLGSYLTLINDDNREMLYHLSNKITYMELNTEPSYMNEYTGALFLPHTDMRLFPNVEKLLK